MDPRPGEVKGLVELAVGARRDLPTGHVLESGLAECARKLKNSLNFDVGILYFVTVAFQNHS